MCIGRVFRRTGSSGLKRIGGSAASEASTDEVREPSEAETVLAKLLVLENHDASGSMMLDSITRKSCTAGRGLLELHMPTSSPWILVAELAAP